MGPKGTKFLNPALWQYVNLNVIFQAKIRVVFIGLPMKDVRKSVTFSITSSPRLSERWI